MTRQDFLPALLVLPGLLLIAVLLVAPVGWLFINSFIDAQHDITIEHYERFVRPIYIDTFATTFKVAAIVTVLAMLLGYPTAYMMVSIRPSWSIVCVGLVLLPFWTSILARAFAWLVLLQNRGLINTLLVQSGLIEVPIRLVHNFTGTVIGMVHVMLPVMIFPLMAAMRAVEPEICKAAMVCGASPSRMFMHVYFPLTLPGLYVGTVLVFMFSIGYYTTPALLGGGRVNMVANQIETDLALYGDWGMASALGVTLTVITVSAMLILHRIFGFERASLR